MILVDTSIWIDLFSKKPSFAVDVEQIPLFATCPPIIQELLQGLTRHSTGQKIRDGFLSLTCVGEPLQKQTFIHAADIYRRSQMKGYTIRSSVDCLIAAIAIESDLVLWHKDRDFDFIAQTTELRVIKALNEL